LFRITDLFILIGFVIIFIGIMYLGVVYGSNSTSNMTLDCIRMFYSDSWDKGYVIDLAKFCSNGG
jgi:hypothetical protein